VNKPAARLAAIAVWLMALGCGTQDPTPVASPTTDPNADRRGGILRVGMDLASYEEFQLSEDGTSFNFVWDPQATWAEDPFALFRCCLLRTLMSYNGRPTNEGGAILRPDLADGEPQISADGLTWTFTLKHNVQYAPPYSETTVVAADFIRAMERTLRPDPFAPPGEPHAFGPYAVYFQEVIAGAEEFTAGDVSTISGLEARDPLTLVVHLTRPAGDLGARLTLPAAAPIPAGAADGHDAGYGRYLVASGPYMIEGSEQLDPSLPADQQPMVSGYVPGTSLTLIRNPNWDAATDTLRPALVDRIELIQFSDYDAELAAVLSGQIDFTLQHDLDPADVDRFRADAQLAQRVHVAPGLISDWITMNVGVPPFDDVHVRRAVNLVTNKALLLALLDPGAKIQAHAVPDAISNGLLSEYDPYATVDSAGSIDRAKAEMALSGYDSDGDGLCDDAVCADVYLPVRDDDPERWAAAQAWASQVAAIGVVLRLERTDPNEAFLYGSLPESRGAVGFIFGWKSDYLNGSSWFGPLASGATLGADIGNLSMLGATPEQLDGWGYDVTDVPNIDAQIASCVALTGAAQFACWAEVDQYLMERVAPWIPLDTRQVLRFTSANVRDFMFDASLAVPSLANVAVTGP